MVDRQDAQGEAPSHVAAEANILQGVALGAQAVVANIHVGLVVQEDVHVGAAPHAHHPAVANRLAATDCGRAHGTESALSAVYRPFLSLSRRRDCCSGCCYHGTVI